MSESADDLIGEIRSLLRGSLACSDSTMVVRCQVLLKRAADMLDADRERKQDHYRVLIRNLRTAGEQPERG